MMSFLVNFFGLQDTDVEMEEAAASPKSVAKQSKKEAVNCLHFAIQTSVQHNTFNN